MYRRGIAVREQASDTASLGMARNLERLGMKEMVNQNYSAAESDLNRALEIEEKCGAQNDFVALTIQSLASVCMTIKTTPGPSNFPGA